MRIAKVPSATWSVGLVSLGCAKNLVDTEHMATVLRRDHILLAHSPDEADVVLVNTCGFIGDARRESADAIRRACIRKNAGFHRAVIVAGCLAQRYRRELFRAMPDVDAFLGLDQVDRIGQIVRRLQAGQRRVFAITPVAMRLYESGDDRLVLTGGPFAYLKIAEGCDHRCAFCAIPAIRGRYRSRTPAAILREAETLLGQGIRELNLIAQDVTAYGRDRHARNGLARLIRDLGRIGGRFWIRLLYGYPDSVSDELLDTIGMVDQACHYLDVPIQHSHPAMLRAMRRAGTAAAVGSLTEHIRSHVPDMVVRTTCIAGFPGETAAHFRHLREYLAMAAFDHLGVFRYSPEEGTPAFTMVQPVAAATADRRRRILMREQQMVVHRRHAAMIGRKVEILLTDLAVSGRTKRTGRTRGQAPDVDGMVMVSGVPARLRSGAFITARITGGQGYDLAATYGASR